MKHFRLSSWALLAVLALAGCKDDDTDAPATSGPDTPAPGLPADCFAIDVETASTEGIKLTYTPEDPEMLYIDMLFDESYLTEDGLTTDDISAQMLKTANLMISKDSEGGGLRLQHRFLLRKRNDLPRSTQRHPLRWQTGRFALLSFGDRSGL